MNILPCTILVRWSVSVLRTLLLLAFDIYYVLFLLLTSYSTRDKFIEKRGPRTLRAAHPGATGNLLLERIGIVLDIAQRIGTYSVSHYHNFVPVRFICLPSPFCVLLGP